MFIYSGLAQLVEHSAVNTKDVSSNLTSGANLTPETNNNPQHKVNTMNKWTDSAWFNQWEQLARNGQQ